jgi:hypothetical protein
MIVTLPFILLAQVASQTAAPGAWTLETPKAAPAIFTYARDGAQLVQMTCQPDSGQILFRVAVRKRLAARKSGTIWTNAVGMPAPWPASVTLTSTGAASTLRGALDAETQTGASIALAEASTQAPVIRNFGKAGALTFTIAGESIAPEPAKAGDARKFLRACG